MLKYEMKTEIYRMINKILSASDKKAYDTTFYNYAINTDDMVWINYKRGFR